MQLFILLEIAQFFKPKDDFDFLTGSQQLLLSTKSPKPGVSTFHNLMMMMNLVMVKVMMMMIIGP